MLLDGLLQNETMIIDAHGHLVPETLLSEIQTRAADFPSVSLVTKREKSLAFSFCGKAATRPVAPFLQDVRKRLAWMASNGIDRQVVGCWLDMFGYELPGEEGEQWSRMINRHMAGVAREHPEFIPLASVPLQDGARAAAVLADAMAVGFKGVMIGTQPDAAGGVLDAPDLDPFWRTAHESGAIVYIHPVFESGDARVRDYGMANAVGRITDTLIAVSRIIFSGHVARYSGARLVAVTGGAALPYVLGRLQRNYNLQSGNLGDPEVALKQLYYDTIVHDPRALRFMADIVGADRIMMGSDSPFPIGDGSPMDVVSKAGFSAADASRINGGLAMRLFGLDGGEAGD
ncbi:MAG: amidohydrolase family protein [Gammaproteobacteria bacterium]|nr:amidohydrolase family protein [Gammaproteobacteria bacterium]